MDGKAVLLWDWPLHLCGPLLLPPLGLSSAYAPPLYSLSARFLIYLALIGIIIALMVGTDIGLVK